MVAQLEFVKMTDFGRTLHRPGMFQPQINLPKGIDPGLMKQTGLDFLDERTKLMLGISTLSKARRIALGKHERFVQSMFPVT